MKSARLILGLTAALLTLNPVQATTFTTLTLTQQAKKAQVIVRATVGAPTTTQSAGVSWINYPLTVTETIAGDVASLPVREGKPTLMFLAGLQDVPALNSGQDVFLLLYTGTQDSPLVGFNQGAYPVVNGRVTRWNEAATAAFETEAPAPTATPTPATTTNRATPATNTATATAPTGTVPTATPTAPATPPVDGATAAVSNPVTPSPTPTTPPATPPATAGTGTTTTPPAGTTTPTTPVNPATASPAAAATPITAATTPTPPVPAPAVTPAPTAPPDAFERDPARFRDQLRAARTTP